MVFTQKAFADGHVTKSITTLQNKDLLVRTGPTVPPNDCTKEVLISGCPGAHSPVHLLRSPNQQMLAHWLCSRYLGLCELMRQGPFLPPSSAPSPLVLSRPSHRSARCRTECVWTVQNVGVGLACIMSFVSSFQICREECKCFMSTSRATLRVYTSLFWEASEEASCSLQGVMAQPWH